MPGGAPRAHEVLSECMVPVFEYADMLQCSFIAWRIQSHSYDFPDHRPIKNQTAFKMRKRSPVVAMWVLSTVR